MKYPFFNTKHPVIILRVSLFAVTPSHVASTKIECQNFSYVYRRRKHWECKYSEIKTHTWATDKYTRGTQLRPVHTRDPINPRSLPLWKNGQIGNERALIGESVCWSKIQRGLVGPALRGRGERDKFSKRLKNGRG